jgi:hypothetical protein
MPPAIILLPRQRQALAQALADAVSYRDHPSTVKPATRFRTRYASSAQLRSPAPALTSISAAR